MGQGAGRPRAGHPCWPLSYVTRPPGGCRALAAAGAALVLAAAAAPAAPAAGVAGNGRLGFYTLDSRQLAERMGLSVNVANGNLLLEADDMDVTGTGLDLSVTRAYNSRSPAAGALGFGWTMFPSEDVALRTPAGGGADLEFDGPGGYALRFTHNADGSFTTPPGIDATLCSTAVAGCAAGGSFGLTFNSSGLRWAFTNGVVTQIRDRNNNAITFAYTSGKLTSVTDTQGRVTTIARDASGRITQVNGPGGRCYSYAYDSAGNLASYTDPLGGVTKYAYDSAHRLTRVTDPRGKWTNVAYDSSGRVASVKRVTDYSAVTGPTESFTYPSSTQTVATDPRGGKVTYTYDAQLRVTQAIDQLGRQTSTSYTPAGNVLSFTAGTGTGSRITTLTYNQRDRATSGASPAGEQVSAGYDSTAFPYQPTSVTDEQGKSQFFGYDGNGNLQSVKDNATSPVNSTTIARNPNGTVASITDGRGVQTAYTYDAKGNLIKATPPLPLGTTTLTNDALSRVQTVTDGKGQKRTITYDALDRVTRISMSNGLYFCFYYDADGNLTQRTDSDGNVTDYTYDALNERTKESFPHGLSNTYTYDAAGNLATLTDGDGKVTYTYDAINRVTKLLEPESTSVGFAYSDSGTPRTETETLPGGATSVTNLDASGKPTSIVVKNGAGAVLKSFTYTYAFTPAGATSPKQGSKIQSVTDQTGQRTDYEYNDPEGRLTRAVTRNGATVVSDYTYAYDKAGNRTRKTKNGAVTTYAYNNANELCFSVSGASSATCAAPPAGAQLFAYDANGNETSNGGGLSVFYDVLDRSIRVLTPDGQDNDVSYLSPTQSERVVSEDVSFQDNLLGLGARFSPIAGDTYYSRTPGGAPVSQRNSDRSTQYFAKDALGSTVGLLDTTGALVKSYTYDPDGADTASGPGTITWLRFTGAYRSSGALYHLGMRFYDPATARFTQLDPILQPEDLVDGNRYLYAGGDPINRTDPTGLLSFDLDKLDAKGIVKGAWDGAINGAAEGFIEGGPEGAAAGAATGAVTGAGETALRQAGDEDVDNALDVYDTYGKVKSLKKLTSKKVRRRVANW